VSEDEIDRLVDFILERLKGHHAGLADSGRHSADHMQASAPMWQDIEAGLQTRQSAKSGVLGDSISRLFVGG
jgi:hypothetical protein